MTQISARLITRQRHDRDQTENRNRGQLFRASWLSSARCSDHSKKQNIRRELDGLLNARGRDFGWAQTQTSIHVIARESATNNEQRTEILCRCRLK